MFRFSSHTPSLTVRALLSMSSFLMVAPSAHAQSAAAISGIVLQLPVLVLGAGSSCLRIVYDANGNRVEQTVATVAAGGMVWGSGTYGCAFWHP